MFLLSLHPQEDIQDRDGPIFPTLPTAIVMAPFQGLILCVWLVAEYRGVGAWSVMIGALKVAAEGLEKKGLVGTS
jgi:hypothetical protein